MKQEHYSRQPLAHHTIKMSELAALKLMSESYSHLGEDYILSHVTSLEPPMEEPIARRFDGLTVIVNVSEKGSLTLTIDVDTCTIPPFSICFIPPDSIFKPVKWDGAERLNIYVLFLSQRFISDIAIDLNAISTNVFSATSPVLTLTEEQIMVLVRYFDLLHLNSSGNGSYKRQIARSLVCAAGYQLIDYGEAAAERQASVQSHSRKLTYTRNFFQLVRTNHREQRSIGFYAEKMFISPKYLSLVIKETTGRSAAEWIDHYVLQEAKNMLRYSGKNIQQIAYEMNFVNQSAFGKFFKNLTGMSPTKFQNT